MIGGRAIARIEPSAHVAKGVNLGRNVYVGHGAVIEGNVTLGDDCYVGHHCVIGVPPQSSTQRYELDDDKHAGDCIVIGARTVLREFSKVDHPMKACTRIGSGCYVMAYSYVSHDTELGDGVILADNVQIGGWSKIHPFAHVGLSVAIHQRSTIGAYAMIGMGAVITRDVPPFVVALGNPARFAGKMNVVGLERAGRSRDDVERIERGYRGAAFSLDAFPEHARAHVEAFKCDARRKVLSISGGFDRWASS